MASRSLATSLGLPLRTAVAATAGEAGSGGEGLRYPRPAGAHSSAGERPLHTREVPGSIPGAPILGNGLVKPFFPTPRAACPFYVQARADVILKPARLDALLALVQMPVRAEEQRTAVCVPHPL